jgi:hypothetical protein
MPLTKEDWHVDAHRSWLDCRGRDRRRHRPRQPIPPDGGVPADVAAGLAFLSTWQQRQDLEAISRVARETLVLVPLGLPFFVPLAFAGRLGLGFWSAFGAGLLLASITVGLWLWLGPRSI